MAVSGLFRQSSVLLLEIVIHRYAPPGRAPSELDALNLEIVATMFDDGFAMLTTSVLRGRVVIRLCPINPRTTEDDIRQTLERLDGFARALRA